MGSNHDHSISRTAKTRPLVYALILTASFMLAEIIGGILTSSLALISDAMHMMTDTAALVIALIAIRVGQKAADKKRTFGYYRFEILAANMNALMLFFVAAYIIYEAIERLRAPAEILSVGMLVIAILGLIVNLIAMRLLAASKETSLNMKGAYLEVWGDMLGSLGVIAAAVIIYYTGWAWVDSLIACLIGLWVLPRAWILMKETINILLEGVPEHINIEELSRAMTEIEGVTNIHDLHVWALTNDKISLTAHVRIDEKFDCNTVLEAIRAVLAKEYHITHATLQHERQNCSDVTSECYLPK